jgi:Trypsin-co-occurring domain 1
MASHEQPMILIEPSTRGGLAAADDAANDAADAIPAIAQALAAPLAQFWAALSAKDARPDEVELKLGLSFESGLKWWIVAKTGATIDVTVKWKKDPAPAVVATPMAARS